MFDNAGSGVGSAGRGSPSGYEFNKLLRERVKNHPSEIKLLPQCADSRTRLCSRIGRTGRAGRECALQIEDIGGIAHGIGK